MIVCNKFSLLNNYTAKWAIEIREIRYDEGFFFLVYRYDRSSTSDIYVS